MTKNVISRSGDQYFATVKDCERTVNIRPFGNCKSRADRDFEEAAIRQVEEGLGFKPPDTVAPLKAGTCRYLMNLEDEWENLKSYGEYVYIDEEKVDKITMEAVLFCRHGGFIYPVTSGFIPTNGEIDITSLITLEDLTFLKEAMKAVGRGMTQEKMLAAIYLTNSILNDPELLERGADPAWASGVVANMLWEGEPGQLESYHYSSGSMPNYLRNAVNHGYDRAYDANGGELSQAATVPDLVKIINCNTHGELSCGFGYGMFQWTFDRTASALGEVDALYGTRTDSLTVQEIYVAEYNYFRTEITEKPEYVGLLDNYRSTGDAAGDASNAAENFRSVYEGNSHNLYEVGEIAVAWQKELEKVGVK